jgi:hypothetical protein
MRGVVELAVLLLAAATTIGVVTRERCATRGMPSPLPGFQFLDKRKQIRTFPTLGLDGVNDNGIDGATDDGVSDDLVKPLLPSFSSEFRIGG